MHASRKSAPLFRKCLTGFVSLTTLAALGLAAPAVHAQTAYVDSFDGTADTFGTLNLQTGQFTSIGTLSDQLLALGFGSNGTLYGLVSTTNSNGVFTGTSLYRVATDTGAETFVQSFADFNVFGGSGNADGTFTAITQGAAANNNRSSLFTVDPVAGTATAGAPTFANADGLAVADGSGNVFVSDMSSNTGSNTDGLDVVDTAAKHPGTAFLGDTGLNDLFTGLFSGGQLYTFGFDPTSAGTPEGVYTLNTGTGVATLVAQTSNDQDIEAAALAPAAVPEASTTVSFGLLALGGLVLVKRRKASSSA